MDQSGNNRRHGREPVRLHQPQREHWDIPDIPTEVCRASKPEVCMVKSWTSLRGAGRNLYQEPEILRADPAKSAGRFQLMRSISDSSSLSRARRSLLPADASETLTIFDAFLNQHARAAIV